jgi:hypothetical protein
MSSALKGFTTSIPFNSLTPKKQRASVNVKSSLQVNNSMKAEDTFDFTIKSGNSAAVCHSVKNPEFVVSQPMSLT